jgi:hypothetical protein
MTQTKTLLNGKEDIMLQEIVLQLSGVNTKKKMEQESINAK